eukprot:CAMPEP_0172522050 /NCGR_PEP_ID=MMETSP1066-20121228/292911_1 /TAXON_ID=671091 /ORGANISM="Coscinodiscus wailesii, Strain CCMP2513" /LENGTH=826 /DNA_ID=CAMNT_0013305019 /DNA_START=162 /DNA_END=2642 /DNA_ORIENTATION=+
MYGMNYNVPLNVVITNMNDITTTHYFHAERNKTPITPINVTLTRDHKQQMPNTIICQHKNRPINKTPNKCKTQVNSVPCKNATKVDQDKPHLASKKYTTSLSDDSNIANNRMEQIKRVLPPSNANNDANNTERDNSENIWCSTYQLDDTEHTNCDIYLTNTSDIDVKVAHANSVSSSTVRHHTNDGTNHKMYIPFLNPDDANEAKDPFENRYDIFPDETITNKQDLIRVHYMSPVPNVTPSHIMYDDTKHDDRHAKTPPDSLLPIRNSRHTQYDNTNNLVDRFSGACNDDSIAPTNALAYADNSQPVTPNDTTAANNSNIDDKSANAYNSGNEDDSQTGSNKDCDSFDYSNNLPNTNIAANINSNYGNDIQPVTLNDITTANDLNNNDDSTNDKVSKIDDVFADTCLDADALIVDDGFSDTYSDCSININITANHDLHNSNTHQTDSNIDCNAIIDEVFDDACFACLPDIDIALNHDSNNENCDATDNPNDDDNPANTTESNTEDVLTDICFNSQIDITANTNSNYDNNSQLDSENDIAAINNSDDSTNHANTDLSNTDDVLTQIETAELHHTNETIRLLQESARNSLLVIPIETMNQLRLATFQIIMQANDALKRHDSKVSFDDESIIQKISNAENAGQQLYIDILAHSASKSNDNPKKINNDVQDAAIIPLPSSEHIEIANDNVGHITDADGSADNIEAATELSLDYDHGIIRPHFHDHPTITPHFQDWISYIKSMLPSHTTPSTTHTTISRRQRIIIRTLRQNITDLQTQLSTQKATIASSFRTAFMAILYSKLHPHSSNPTNTLQLQDLLNILSSIDAESLV